jgi:hypothetical protein
MSLSTKWWWRRRRRNYSSPELPEEFAGSSEEE